MGQISAARSNRTMRRLLVGAPLVMSAMALSGCMNSPTYGTGKTSNMQLMEDVTGIMNVGEKKREPIAYTPRPELVKPGDDLALVAPQDNVTATANGAWPESPEARLARIKAEATANQDNPSYRAAVIVDTVDTSPKTIGRIQNGREPVGGPGYNGTLPSPDQRAEFNRRLVATNQGSSGTRKYLSEPPTTYRAAEATAPTGDVGEDEWKKERRQKRVSRKKGGGLRDLLPW